MARSKQNQAAEEAENTRDAAEQAQQSQDNGGGADSGEQGVLAEQAQGRGGPNEDAGVNDDPNQLTGDHQETGEGNQAGSATGDETQHGAERGESDTGGVSAEGEGATTSHIESVQRSGELSGADGAIPPGSTGLKDLDPELRNEMSQAERTVQREQFLAKDLEKAETRRTARKIANDKQALEELDQELVEVQATVDHVVRRRDDLRTERDRLVDRIAASEAQPYGAVTAGYFAAADKQAAEEAAVRKSLVSVGLGSLLGGTTRTA